MTRLIRGIDLSSWNHAGNKAIDFEKVRASGISFVMVKATQGDSYVSPWLKEDLDGAAFAGLLTGAYHFYEVGPTPVEQAEHFIAALTGHVLDLGAWLDWETGPMTPYEAANLVTQFTAHAEETRRPVGLYCDQSWATQLGEGNYRTARWWAAAPGVKDPPAGCFMWQTGTEAVDGIDGEVDSDRLEITRGINIPMIAARPKPVEAATRPQEASASTPEAPQPEVAHGPTAVESEAAGPA